MVALILATLVSLQPYDPVARDHCDLLELNHCHNEDGRLVFSQVIFWEWNESRFRVKAYRVLRSDQEIIRNGSGAEITFIDKVTPLAKSGTLRSVSAPAFRETWTQHDPELDDRLAWDQTRRTELANP